MLSYLYRGHPDTSIQRHSCESGNPSRIVSPGCRLRGHDNLGAILLFLDSSLYFIGVLPAKPGAKKPGPLSLSVFLEFRVTEYIKRGSSGRQG